MSASAMERSCIPIRRLVIHNEDDMPDVYSSTPGGTIFGTTPGGTKIIYERAFLMEMRNSPMARTPPTNLPKIPGVTVDLDKRPSPTKGTKEAFVHQESCHFFLQSFESPNGMPHNIDWTTRIQEAVNASHDTHVPPDITFKIEDNGSTYKIEAHKVVMGWVSKVFNRMLFVTDTVDKGTKELLVKGTTKQAFQIMKDAIYNTEPINDLLIGKSVHEVFAVLDLVTRYEIPELELSVKNYINNFPLTEENVLQVAEDAMHYAGTFKGTFKDEAQLLLIGCSKFLKPRFTDAESVFEYIADHKDHSEVLLKLMALMKQVPPAPTNRKDVPPAPTVCLNCQHDVCLNGREIQNDQFRVGLMVTNSGSAYRGCQRLKMGKGRVTNFNIDCDIDGYGEVKLKAIEGGPFGGFNDWHDMNNLGTPCFLFCCK